MNFSFVYIITLFTFILSNAITPRIIRLSETYNLFDQPDHRKVHNKPIARIGGISIFLSYLIGTIIPLYALINLNIFSFNNNEFILTIFFGSTIFFLIGIIDDLTSLSPFLRLLIQFSVATIVWCKGLRIDYFQMLPTDLYQSSSIDINNLLSLLITVLWIVGLTNAFNWIDGLDGLACGIALISSLSLSIIALLNNQISSSFICLGIAGSCLGFLKYNLNPAKIFMGDGGSYFIGFVLSTIGIQSVKNETGVLQIYILIILFMIPLLDMIKVIFKRVISGNSPFYPDRSHFHHYLIDSGLNQNQTVRIIFLLSLIFSIFSIYLTS